MIYAPSRLENKIIEKKRNYFNEKYLKIVTIKSLLTILNFRFLWVKIIFLPFNRYWRKRPEVDASIFDSSLGRGGKKDKKIACQLSWTSFES